jgi:glycosyltransferase involved in cell wall biosynthesis
VGAECRRQRGLTRRFAPPFVRSRPAASSGGVVRRRPSLSFGAGRVRPRRFLRQEGSSRRQGRSRRSHPVRTRAVGWSRGRESVPVPRAAPVSPGGVSATRNPWRRPAEARVSASDTGPRLSGRSGLEPLPADMTVVICAYTEDRWSDIHAAVESVLGQHTPVRQTVVVIDHNAALLARLRASYPELPIVGNNRARGLSGARNTGVELAVGAIVAFLDDDAAAPPQWSDRMMRHYDDPAVLGVGGSAYPLWATSRPDWLPPEFDWTVGCSYVGLPTTIATVRNFLGCNMSFRRESLAAVGGFADELGRIGRVPLGCEETELCIRLQQLQPTGRLLYDPQLDVRHRVSADRQQFAYFRARCRAEGISKAVVTENVGRGDGLASERSYVAHVLPRALLREFRLAIRTRDLSALARAGAICVGVSCAAAGYVRGRFVANSGKRANGRKTVTWIESRPPRPGMIVTEARVQDAVRH